MNAMELGSLWSQARAVHPDDPARQNESFIAALGVFAELATAKERTARIEAQQRLVDMQELAAKAGLAHMKVVQEAVAEAVAEERETETPAWIDAAFRNMIAQRLYSQIRVEFDHMIGPWETFDAEAQQRIVDAIKPDGAT